MMEENKEENILEGDAEVYELGYHLSPTIGEENILVEASKVKEMIVGLGGEFISEGLPVLKHLSYPMVKKQESKNLNFNKAYFGWVKFEIIKSKIDEIKNRVESNKDILRFLIIKTVRENTLYTPKAPVFKKEEYKEEERAVSEETPSENKQPASETEIDKSIDDLVTTIN